MKLWCPNAGSVCEDGMIAYHEVPCVFYDEETQVCLMRENAKRSIGALMMQGKIFEKVRQESETKEEERIDEILKRHDRERKQ